MTKKIDDLRKAATAAREAATAKPDDKGLSDAATAAEAALAEAETAAAKTKTVKVRVILDQGEHKINDVLTLPEAEARVAVNARWADANPEAVAYAEGEATPEA